MEVAKMKERAAKRYKIEIQIFPIPVLSYLSLLPFHQEFYYMRKLTAKELLSLFLYLTRVSKSSLA